MHVLLTIGLAIWLAMVSNPAAADLVVCYQAQGAYKARGFDVAVQLLTECLDTAELTPESRSSVLRARGSAYMQMNVFDRALADLDAAVKLQPGEAQGYLYRGELNRTVGNLEAALRDYDEGLRLGPDNEKAREVRGLTAAALAQRNQQPARAATAQPNPPERQPDRSAEKRADKAAERPPVTQAEKPDAPAGPGAQIKEVQARLTQLGYYRGPNNGRLDRATVAAIKSFQGVKGIPVDGAVSASLLDRLKNSM